MTNLLWVCECDAARERALTLGWTAILPDGFCPSCGRDYDTANRDKAAEVTEVSDE